MDNAIIQTRIATVEDAALIADLARRTFYDTFSKYNTEENMRIYQQEQNTLERQMAEVGKDYERGLQLLSVAKRGLALTRKLNDADAEG